MVHNSILERVAFSKIDNGLKKLDNDQYEEALKIFEDAKSVCTMIQSKNTLLPQVF